MDKAVQLNVIEQGKLYTFNNTKLDYSNTIAYDNTRTEIGLISPETSFNLNMTVSYTTNLSNIVNQSGPPLPDNTDIGQTKRLVLILNSSTGFNETALLSVRVW
ncbi:MAG: hypothetical protein WC556_05485 [Candidatus Methanoperedens sp.]